MIDGRTVGKHNGRVERPNLNTPDFADAVVSYVDEQRARQRAAMTSHDRLMREMLAVQFTQMLEDADGSSGGS